MSEAASSAPGPRGAPELLRPDICVIGGGAGGLSVAAAAAAFGVAVVLVEKGKMGGECLNAGCVPSKSLIAAGKRAHAIAEARAFGVVASTAEVDFSKVHAHVHEVIAAIAPNDSKERFNGLGVRVIEGAARFKNRRTVAVGDAVEIRARRFVIATGSSPSLPPIPGLESVPYLTNETVFDLRMRPQHLIVIGAGAIGLELAQAFRRLGCEVTVLEAAQPLAREDGECAAVVLDALAREGVPVLADVEIERIEPAGSKLRAVLRGGARAIEGSHLLVATGRADVMVDPVLNLWDAAALQPIIEGAGGHFSDWQGRPTVHTGNAVATNARLAGLVLSITRDA